MLLAAALCAFALAGSAHAQADVDDAKPTAEHANSAAHSSAISMDGLLRFFAAFHNNPQADAMLAGLARYHGLAFKMSDDARSKLKMAGASEALLEALDAAPVRIPAPPKIAPGFLAVLCQPVDCDVEIDGTRVGTTARGALAGVPVPAGEARVRVSRENFDVDPGEETVSIASGNTTSVRFHLALSRRILQDEGAKIYRRVLSALGSGNSPSGDDAPMQATGALDVRGSDAEARSWSVAATFSGVHISRFQLSKGGRKCELAIEKHGDVSWKKRPKGQEGQELEEALRLVIDYQLAALMDLVGSPPFKIFARTLDNAGVDPNSLRAQGENEAYVIDVDAASLPSAVALESDGLNRGTRIAYSNYVDVGGFLYPLQTEIARPGGESGARQSVTLSFGQIAPGSNGKSKTRKRGAS